MIQFIHSSYFHHLLESLAVGAVIANTKGSVYAANASASRILGHTVASIQNDFFSPTIFGRFDNQNELRNVIDQANAGQQPQNAVQLHYTHPEGKTLTLTVSVSLLEQYGKIFGVLIQFNDITEIVSLHKREKQILEEKSLLQMQRIESLNSLSMAIAHQIRNPMMTISGFANLLVKKRENNERDLAWLEAILEGAGRLEMIVSAVSDYNSLSFTESQSVSLRSILSETLTELKQQYTQFTDKVSFDLLKSDYILDTDPHLLKVALHEIILNSLESLEFVEFKDETSKQTIQFRCTPKSFGTILEICDTGKGVPPDSLPFLFDPFFTTKAVGVGMGLCKAKRALHEINGEILIENRTSGGVKNILTLHECLTDTCKPKPE